jgi:hypothetical protein
MAIRCTMPLVLVLLATLAPGRADAHPPGLTWSEHLQAVDEALARNDVNAAQQAWRRGYAAALRSGTWIGLVELGDAYLRIPATGEPVASRKPMARQAYLRAFVRAQAQGSAEGTWLVALAFDQLGDAQVAANCMRVAERLAQRRADAGTIEQVMLLRERWAWQPATRPDQRP